MTKLLASFRAADANGDGVLQRDELRSVLESVGDGTEPVPMRWVTDEDLDRVLQRYDANRDGVISFDEYTLLAQDKVRWAARRIALPRACTQLTKTLAAPGSRTTLL
jgi:Ca2+-binding EF-hand superfamily protein